MGKHEKPLVGDDESVIESPWLVALKETGWIALFAVVPYVFILFRHWWDGGVAREVLPLMFAGGAPFVSLITLSGLTWANFGTLPPTLMNKIARFMLGALVVLCAFVYGDMITMQPAEIPVSSGLVIALVGVSLVLISSLNSIRQREESRR